LIAHGNGVNGLGPGQHRDRSAVMLVFVDRPKWIKVQRSEQSDEGVRRVRLGLISKNDFSLDDELRRNLSPPEVAEVEQVLALYRAIPAAQQRASALKFPHIVREVLDYIRSGEASPAERLLLAGAFEEGLRQLRKLEKASAGA
jgi:hypothetical protein